MSASSPIVWTSEYSVGNPLLDAQHQRLLALCNQASESMGDNSPEGVEAFHNILNDLTRYVREHFLTEEKVLEQHHFADLDTHKAMHLDYEERLGEFLIAATEGSIDKIALQVYLNDWWRDHILRSDKAYASAIRPA